MTVIELDADVYREIVQYAAGFSEWSMELHIVIHINPKWKSNGKEIVKKMDWIMVGDGMQWSEKKLNRKLDKMDGIKRVLLSRCEGGMNVMIRWGEMKKIVLFDEMKEYIRYDD